MTLGKKFTDTLEGMCSQLYDYIKSHKIEVLWAKVRANHMVETQEKLLFSADFINLIEGMLNFNPANRLTLKDIISHAWMKNG